MRAKGGVPPKLGPKLGHAHKAKDAGPTDPGDGQPKHWPIPDGEWTVEACRWWDTVMVSVAAERAWLPEDRPKLERLLWMVDAWWRLTQTNVADAMRMSDQVRRLEAEMYLSPADRARAGLIPDKAKPETPVGSSARARLLAAG